jgi:hypothetical protein
MNIENLEDFIKKLEELGADRAKEAYEYFQENWPNFSRDERKILSGVVGGFMLRIAESQVEMKAKLYWLAMITLSEKEIIDGEYIDEEDEDTFPSLTLAPGINGNLLTKVFRGLKDRGIITSSYEHIAEALAIIFPIGYRTAYNDLTQTKRLQKVPDLLK